MKSAAAAAAAAVATVVGGFSFQTLSTEVGAHHTFCYLDFILRLVQVSSSKTQSVVCFTCREVSLEKPYLIQTEGFQERGPSRLQYITHNLRRGDGRTAQHSKRRRLFLGTLHPDRAELKQHQEHLKQPLSYR